MQDQKPVLGNRFAHDGEIEVPFDEYRPRNRLQFWFQNHQHPFLRFGQHHFIGRHMGFALRHGIQLQPDAQTALVAHLKGAELYESQIPADGVYCPPIDFPPHERCVEIDVDLGAGSASATIFGADRSHEYISENADYRS